MPEGSLLPSYFISVSIALRLLSGASYATATWQRTARPHLVSWFFWSLTALIAFAAGVSKGDIPGSLITLAIGIGPLLVFGVAVWRRNGEYTFNRLEISCVILTILGIGLWLTADNPLLAVLCSIAADIFSSVPTIQKCYMRPQSEFIKPYAITVASMAIGLLTFTEWSMVTWLFPAYILCINITFITAKALGMLRKRTLGEPIPVRLQA